jgi:MFS family permease
VGEAIASPSCLDNGPRQGKPGARAAVSRPRLRADLTPLRTSRDFRLLYTSRTVTALGTDAIEVALLVRARQLTGSTFAVGLLGAMELVPLVVFGLYGGVLADRFDRRRLIVACEAGLACCAALLMLNALVPHPAVWPLYLVTALMMAMAALQRPSLEASMPRVVPRDQLTAAAALMSMSQNVSYLAGTTLGGVLAAGPARSTCTDWTPSASSYRSASCGWSVRCPHRPLSTCR